MPDIAVTASRDQPKDNQTQVTINLGAPRGSSSTTEVYLVDTTDRGDAVSQILKRYSSDQLKDLNFITTSTAIPKAPRPPGPLPLRPVT